MVCLHPHFAWWHDLREYYICLLRTCAWKLTVSAADAVHLAAYVPVYYQQYQIWRLQPCQVCSAACITHVHCSDLHDDQLTIHETVDRTCAVLPLHVKSVPGC